MLKNRVLEEVNSKNSKAGAEKTSANSATSSAIEHDFSHTKRLLEVKRIATRADGIFELTDLGEAMWRVEHFIRQSKLESVQPEPSSGDRSP